MSFGCFKSCPRVGGIADSAAYYDRSIEVSSRAPVWGASLALRLPGCREAFQVVPPCGGHPEQSQSRNAGSGFKSCPRVGGITYELQKQKQELFQVVPPCGGHRAVGAVSGQSVLFQVVPPCGGHRRGHWRQMPEQRFQVVPPCGGHHIGFLPWTRPEICFKSCPRVGGITPGMHYCQYVPVFQVVPPCGGHRRC